MSLPKDGPRKFRRPAQDEGEEVVRWSPPRGGGIAAGVLPALTVAPARSVPSPPLAQQVVRAVRRQPVRQQPRDAARVALEEVLAVRGKPIDRKRGMRPGVEFRAAAERYVVEHHYAYCVKFARSRGARHVAEEDMVQACLLGAYVALERYDAGHETAYRFLPYAKWYMLCETNRLLHREEPLVVVDDRVKRDRGLVASSCPDEMSDGEAAAVLGMAVEAVRLARSTHLGHEHRAVDERSRVVRRSLAEVSAERDDHLAALRRVDGLDAALAQLDPLLRRVLRDEYGVGEDPGVPPPRTDGARRSLHNLALRQLRERLAERRESAVDLAISLAESLG